MSFHNARHTLTQALRSIIWQTYPNWELILLDDGSDDGSAESIRAFDDPRIHLYRDSCCRGLPHRLNQGVAIASGELVARMDADDISFPERFERQVDYLMTHPDVDLLATSALLLDEVANPVGLLEVGLSHGAICRRSWHGFPMPHPTWMGRTEWFRRHRYDECADKVEDQALLYQTYLTSQFAGLPDALLGYTYPRLSVRKSLIGRYHYFLTVNKHGGTNHKLLCAAGHTIALMLDLLGIITGLDSSVIKRRVQPIEPNVQDRWISLRQLIHHHAYTNKKTDHSD